MMLFCFVIFFPRDQRMRGPRLFLHERVGNLLGLLTDVSGHDLG